MAVNPQDLMNKIDALVSALSGGREKVKGLSETLTKKIETFSGDNFPDWKFKFVTAAEALNPAIGTLLVNAVKHPDPNYDREWKISEYTAQEKQLAVQLYYVSSEKL